VAIFSEDQCRGSLGSPVAGSISEDAGEQSGVCPICHATLSLGYAGRLPVHEPAPPAP
jgi:hypothetical protein